MRIRAPRIFSELYESRANGSYIKLLNKISRIQVLIVDDFGLSPMKEIERKDFLEIVEDRYESGSTIICGQLPVTKWHAYIGEPTIADTICDRLIHNAYQITLEGESMRKIKTKITKGKEDD